MKRVIMGISGGVDSSVGAYLLKEQGYEVIGVFMRNWEESDPDGACTAAEDYEDAVAVCSKLGIRYLSVNFAKEYYDRVFSKFLADYKQGLTPNPDVFCNKEIKFRAFLDYAKKNLDADFIATGHYARVRHTPWGTMLLRGIDESKDQAYFLSMLSASQLKDVLFPVGGMKKNEVRKMAEELELRNSKKKDSTGICFIGERNFHAFLKSYLGAQNGEIVDIDTGNAVGKHDGLMYYTMAQRRGLGVGGVKGKDAARWYVAKKDFEKNILYITSDEKSPYLWHKTMTIKDVNLISPFKEWNLEKFSCQVKFRHLQKDVDCILSLSKDKTNATVDFLQPQKGVSPGQIAAFYKGEVCFGAGVITKALN